MKVSKTSIKLKQQKTHTHLHQLKLPSKIQKNVQMASDSQGGQQQNMEIIQVISFIEETMQKLKSFGKKFKVQLDSNLTQ